MCDESCLFKKQPLKRGDGSMGLSCICKFAGCYQKTCAALRKAECVWLLAARVLIALVFFRSGLTKIEDFETTVFLFTEEYSVPLLPPYIAALSATFFELVCPVLLVLGLGARFAAAPLLAMTAVIDLTYLHKDEHLFWALALAAIIIYGAGKFSADYLIRKRMATEKAM